MVLLISALGMGDYGFKISDFSQNSNNWEVLLEFKLLDRAVGIPMEFDGCLINIHC